MAITPTLQRTGVRVEISMEREQFNQMVGSLVASTVAELGAYLKEKARGYIDVAKVHLGSAFTRYLDATLERYSRTKTILYRDTPRDLYDFYVPTDVKSGAHSIEDVDARALRAVNGCSIITGTGGSGKSTLMRHLFVSSIRDKGLVPIFVELRLFNTADTDFASFILDILRVNHVSLSPEAMRIAFEGGFFLVLFDGYDEVSPEKRDEVRSAITAMMQECPLNQYVVSSRPDQEFVGWQSAHEFRIMPLSQEKALSLIDRLDYDAEVKARFAAEVQGHLFTTHATFLQNPLLLTIMLMTYSYNASFPTKSHLFYQQVFDTMWSWHDATKAGYKRRMYCDLSKDVFENTVASFAIATYCEATFQLDAATAERFARDALAMTEAECTAEEFLRDMTQSVCVLVQDGLLYSFSHRSFQEYFAALFLVRTSPEIRSSLVDAIVGQRMRDAVCTLAKEMAPDLMEREIFLPMLDSLLETLEWQGETTDAVYLRFLEHVTTKVIIDVFSDRARLLVNATPALERISLFGRLYPNPTLDGVPIGSAEQQRSQELLDQLASDGRKHFERSEFSAELQTLKQLLEHGWLGVSSIEWLASLREQMRRRLEERTASINDILFRKSGGPGKRSGSA